MSFVCKAPCLFFLYTFVINIAAVIAYFSFLSLNSVFNKFRKLLSQPIVSVFVPLLPERMEERKWLTPTEWQMHICPQLKQKFLVS